MSQRAAGGWVHLWWRRRPWWCQCTITLILRRESYALWVLPTNPAHPPTHPSSDPPFQVKRVEELLQQELGRHPTEEEVAARSGMSWAKLNYLHKWVENEALDCLGDVLG